MNETQQIAVTGGRGGLGSRVVTALAELGYRVVSMDVAPIREHTEIRENVRETVIDLQNAARVAEELEGCTAVLHLGAYPDPHCAPNVFMNNTSSTFNILEAAERFGIRKLVFASSESAYGIPWASKPVSPLYLPIDERHPLLPEDNYALSKAVGELSCESFHRRTGMQVVSLRLSSLLTERGYREMLGYLDTPAQWRRVLWSYVDMRDAVEACILSLQAENLGAVSLNIAADDTLSDRPTRELIQEFFPEVTDIRQPLDGFKAMYDNALARELLGWKPKYGWRERKEELLK